MNVADTKAYLDGLKDEVEHKEARFNELETGIKKKFAEKKDLEFLISELDKISDDKSKYKTKLGKEIVELFSLYKDTKSQTEIQKAELDEVIDKKLIILREIKENIENEQSRIAELKSSYDEFFVQIGRREAEIKQKEENFNKNSGQITEREKKLDRERAILSFKIEDISQKEAKIREEEEKIIDKSVRVELKTKEAEKELKSVNNIKQELEKQKIELAEKTKLLDSEKADLSMKKGAVENERNALVGIKGEIEKEQKHIQSQQITLRSAFEELKKYEHKN